MIVSRAERGEQNSNKEDQVREFFCRVHVFDRDRDAPNPCSEECNVRQNVERIRNTQNTTGVSEMVITLRLRDGSVQEDSNRSDRSQSKETENFPIHGFLFHLL